jgi:hypothetical protein
MRLKLDQFSLEFSFLSLNRSRYAALAQQPSSGGGKHKLEPFKIRFSSLKLAQKIRFLVVADWIKFCLKFSNAHNFHANWCQDLLLLQVKCLLNRLPLWKVSADKL